LKVHDPQAKQDEAKQARSKRTDGTAKASVEVEGLAHVEAKTTERCVRVVAHVQPPGLLGEILGPKGLSCEVDVPGTKTPLGRALGGGLATVIATGLDDLLRRRSAAKR